MACYYPLKAFRTSEGISFSEKRSKGDFLGDIELPCGQCIGCRMRRASDWELRIMHEASLHEANCFVTLTYAPGNLPKNGSLEHRDFQLFMKRLRKSFGSGVRFFMCGEYGESSGRAHYHACLFGIDFDDAVPAGKSKGGELFYRSERLSRLWGLGVVSVQPLVRETASYCARYIMKKVLGDGAKTSRDLVSDDGEILPRRPEYAAMSLRPGIGHHWFSMFGRDVFPADYVVSNGSKRSVPRYYDRLLSRSGSVIEDSIKFEREKRARLVSADNTDERRQTRDKVHKAKVRNLSRGAL